MGKKLLNQSCSLVVVVVVVVCYYVQCSMLLSMRRWMFALSPPPLLICIDYRVPSYVIWRKNRQKRYRRILGIVEKQGKINISEIDHLYRRVTRVYVDYFGFCRSPKNQCLRDNIDHFIAYLLILSDLRSREGNKKNEKQKNFEVDDSSIVVGQMTPGHDKIFTVKGLLITAAHCSTAEYW